MSGDRKMGHVQSMGTYFGVFMALLVLTIITYWVAGFDFGGLGNELVAMGIAGIKATLVTLFFMHGKYEGKDVWAFIVYPAVLLFLLLGGLFLDYANRDHKGHGTKYVTTKVPIAQKTHGDKHDAKGDHAKEETHDEEDAHGKEEAHGDDSAAPATEGDEHKDDSGDH